MARAIDWVCNSIDVRVNIDILRLDAKLYQEVFQLVTSRLCQTQGVAFADICAGDDLRLHFNIGPLPRSQNHIHYLYSICIWNAGIIQRHAFEHVFRYRTSACVLNKSGTSKRSNGDQKFYHSITKYSFLRIHLFHQSARCSMQCCLHFYLHLLDWLVPNIRFLEQTHS